VRRVSITYTYYIVNNVIVNNIINYYYRLYSIRIYSNSNILLLNNRRDAIRK